ncbi:PPK2 family polyphosphate:nucleotide phosphotransferase [Arcanobacterium wilhelmae]|uniref:PPK2 family polyphosphate:nucleotide phosphotransferase n=1 Tax=Arcanobacterium wilhelmae TaxID=1803177 RepID=A0ABT9NC04_9ACTO|nr:PPK2 family polyphosphate kinase [Arcanobacterium wilhelmae]MDP9801254.1 PPK2 family polyphosphate:nucleotide phosphotransferase [Arcanobacterium wilhelmae]WFN90600.1 polyphosphate kinase 2 family protein [Arcanobacterium wilhelmae]
MAKAKWSALPTQTLRAGEGFSLADFDASATPGWSAGKAAAEKFMAARGELLSELQERFFANAKEGDPRKLLLVVQGLDTAGKGGIARHVLGMVDPQGVQLASFGVPTEEERAHHYLWRIERALPTPGKIGLFDRSHYEDVLVVRVENLVPQDVWEPRYEEINAWERNLVENENFTIIKVALMPSHAEQSVRLAERLARRDKWWKYNPSDVDTREKWPDYLEAYQAVLDRTSTDVAPWYVVPADHKWYARLAVTELLTQALIGFEQEWPVPEWDLTTEKKRLRSTMTKEERKATQAALDGTKKKVKGAIADFEKAVAKAVKGR